MSSTSTPVIQEQLVTSGTSRVRMDHSKYARGQIYKKDIWTSPSLHSTCPAFLWVYNHVLLKTANEAVVEGMCKGVSKHADSIRGVSFGRYAIIVNLDLRIYPPSVIIHL